MELDLLDRDIVNLLINEVESSEERERKRQAFEAYQVYSGNLKPFVEAELKRTRPKSWKYYTVSNVSVSRMVIDKVAKSYQNPPRRSVDQNGPKTERLNEIYDEAGADRQFMEFDRNFNLSRHALMWVNWRNREQRYQMMSLQDYEWSVVRNKDVPEILEAVVLKFPDTTITSGSGRNNLSQKGDGIPNLISESQLDSGGQARVYAIWTKDQHVVVELNDEIIKTSRGDEIKRSITYVPIDGNPRNINPLGIIPFVYLSKDLSPDNPTVNPITEQTVTFNALWSELLTAANIQGTSIFTLSYDARLQGKMDTVQGSLTSVVELIQPSDPDAKPTEASYISPQPDLAGQRESYLNYLRMVLSEHGITSSQGLDGTLERFSSGLERMIAQADVQQQVNQNQMLYSMVEEKCFEIIRKIDREILNQGTFNKDDALQVIYPKPKVMISDKETLENIQLRLSLGLIEKWEALLILDPNLSENEAKEKLERIQEESMNPVRSLLNANNGPEISGDEDAESE